jgi:hypothetical protein
MHLSARQLRAYAADVDDLHHQQMKSFAEEAADLHLDAARRSRRTVIAAGAAVAGATAVSVGLLPGLVSASSAPPSAPPAGLDDAAIAGYAQGVELAAVAAYGAAAPLLSPEVLPVAELFLGHHQAHADAFGAVAGEYAVSAPNAALLAAVQPILDGLTDEAGALEFAFVLEGQAAYTYAAALTLLQDPAYAAATATILPIESQHQVVLGLALGKAVTDVFPTGGFESAALGDGTDPLAGLDPAAFPA